MTVSICTDTPLPPPPPPVPTPTHSHKEKSQTRQLSDAPVGPSSLSPSETRFQGQRIQPCTVKSRRKQLSARDREADALSGPLRILSRRWALASRRRLYIFLLSFIYICYFFSDIIIITTNGVDNSSSCHVARRSREEQVKQKRSCKEGWGSFVWTIWNLQVLLVYDQIECLSLLCLLICVSNVFVMLDASSKLKKILKHLRMTRRQQTIIIKKSSSISFNIQYFMFIRSFIWFSLIQIW